MPVLSCRSTVKLNLAGLVDGTYSVTVQAVDSLGVAGDPVTLSFTLFPPAPFVVTPPTSPASDRHPQWTFGDAALDADGYTCTATGPGGITAPPVAPSDPPPSPSTSPAWSMAPTPSPCAHWTPSAAPATRSPSPTPSSRQLRRWSLRRCHRRRRAHRSGRSRTATSTSTTTPATARCRCGPAGRRFSWTSPGSWTARTRWSCRRSTRSVSPVTRVDLVVHFAPAAPTVVTPPTSPSSTRTPSWVITNNDVDFDHYICNSRGSGAVVHEHHPAEPGRSRRWHLHGGRPSGRFSRCCR